MATHELTPKEALAQGRATITLARYRAQKLTALAMRAAGIRPTSYADLRHREAAYLAQHREECIAWAQHSESDVDPQTEFRCRC